MRPESSSVSPREEPGMAKGDEDEEEDEEEEMRRSTFPTLAHPPPLTAVHFNFVATSAAAPAADSMLLLLSVDLWRLK